MELVEKVNLREVHYLNALSLETFSQLVNENNQENGKKKQSKLDLKTQFDALKQYCRTVIKTRGETKRIYSYSLSTPDGSSGRLFSGGSLQNLPRIFSSLILKGANCTDIDQVNAHPTILRYICRKHDIPCPQLDFYINNRDRCLSEFRTREEGKQMYLIATNMEKKITNTKSALLKAYDTEIKTIQPLIVALECYKNINSNLTIERENYMGSAINRILCFYENQILQHALTAINHRDIKVAVLMFDGCVVYGNHYEDPSLLEEITFHVNKHFEGLDMHWNYKPLVSRLFVPEDFDPDALPVSPFPGIPSYHDWKAKFELEWCKIKNASIFVRNYCEDGIFKGFIFQDENKLRVAYRHEIVAKKMDSGLTVKVSAIKTWLEDPNMRCFDSFGVYPPPLSDTCLPNVYNLWANSPYESQPFLHESDEDIDMDAVQKFLGHISIMCNREASSYDWLLSWFAHLIQRPAEKPEHALTLIGNQGTGKSTIVNTLAKLLGPNKTLETQTPERDVWGAFNSAMTNAILVVLSETDKRNSYGADGKIKALITDPTMVINQKGKDQFEINSFHRVIQLTNSVDPTPTSNDDRRNFILRCNDELKGNISYFKTLNDALARPHALRSIYWHLKKFDISTWNFRNVPKTKYHLSIIESTKLPTVEFLEQFTLRHIHMNSVSIFGTDLLQEYNTWRIENGKAKLDENIGVFMKNIKLMLPPNGVVGKRHNKGIKQTIDISLLKKHFKLEYLRRTEDGLFVEETSPVANDQHAALPSETCDSDEHSNKKSKRV